MVGNKTMNNKYVRKELFNEVVNTIRDDIKDIKDNHLTHIWDKLNTMEIKSDRRFAMFDKRLWTLIVTSIGIIVALILNVVK